MIDVKKILSGEPVPNGPAQPADVQDDWPGGVEADGRNVRTAEYDETDGRGGGSSRHGGNGEDDEANGRREGREKIQIIVKH